MKNGFAGLLALLLVSLLCFSCSTGPPAADVAAERDRFVAVRDATADNSIDAAERPVFDGLLQAWDQKIAADEAAVARADTTVQDLIRVYGIAAVQLWAGPELQKRSPELFALVDRNTNGILEEQELVTIDPKSPVFAAVVLSTAARLIAEHRAR